MKTEKAIDYLIIGSGFVGQYAASALENLGLNVELGDFSATPIRYNIVEEKPKGTFSITQVNKTKVLGGGQKFGEEGCPRPFFPDGLHLIRPQNGGQSCLCETLRKP